LQTGFAVSAIANGVFYTTNTANANASNVLMSVNYTQKKQFFVPIQANIWTKNNKYNILTDWHFEQFPQTTYGLGGYTTVSDGYTINYTYVRLYQTLLKTLGHDFYAGAGYDLDYFWNIQEVDPPTNVITDFQKYGLSQKSVSSGLTLTALYDSRRNAINPEPGYYANLTYRSNFSFLGSDANWQSLLIDVRTYSHFPRNSKNTLAFWSYNWFTVNGHPPYLNLASTASDTYANMGRGYIQGRYRGMNLVYLESEYRFGITNNGFLGGVVFLNTQSFTEQNSNRFESLLPGYGAGIRIKLNKFSKTSIALDYGFGAHGSQGIFANLGEVF
jgi:outer membrane protein assembly factor BamA